LRYSNDEEQCEAIMEHTPAVLFVALGCKSTVRPGEVTQPSVVAQATTQVNGKSKGATLDPSTPDTSYVKINTPIQLIVYSYAYSDQAQDYNYLATAYSAKYRQTQDAFSRHDMLESMKPQFDELLQDARKHPYVIWTDASSSPSDLIGHYDFTHKAFPIGSVLLNQGTSGRFNVGWTAMFDLSNGWAFSFLPVEDEAKARVIEGFVNKGAPMKLKIFAFAESGGYRRFTARAVKIELFTNDPGKLAEGGPSLAKKPTLPASAPFRFSQ
jgi:hypothetical protein